MRDFLTQIETQVGAGQRRLLERFLADVYSGKVAAEADAIQALLGQVGALLPTPEGDVTDPEGYNSALRALLANLAGLYQEADNLEAAADALHELNRAELDKVELALRDLATLLAASQDANAAHLQYTDVFFETFGPDARVETGREWYRPIPVLERAGQVQSFVPLQIDPADRTLKLQPGGDFSRSTNPAGEPLAQVRLDQLLGLSVDTVHGIDQAVDGDPQSYWRELIMADQPITADPAQVPWLPPTYTGGAACRLHFRWPFAVPFTEIALRPFARFPVQALQVVWDNRKRSAVNYVTDGNFTLTAAAPASGRLWSASGSVGNVVSYPGTGGYADKAHGRVDAVSGRTILECQSFTLSGSQLAYHLFLKCYRTDAMAVHAIVSWATSGAVLLRQDLAFPKGRSDEWFESSHLLTPPSGIAAGCQGRLMLVADGSGTVEWTDVTFTPTAGRVNFQDSPGLEEETLTLALDNAVGTDLWLTLGQPHYEFLQSSVTEGDLDGQALWEQLAQEADQKVAQVYGLRGGIEAGWKVQGGAPDRTPRGIESGGSRLAQEAARLGGRVRDLFQRVARYAQPSQQPRRLARYLYLLGAWDIQIRHREYAPQGLWVSEPFHPRGECRELVLLTNPPLEELGSQVRFWLTARAADGSDRAKQLTGRATFAAAGESPAQSGSAHFTLVPVTRRDVFDGTDRNHRIALPHHPYVNREQLWRTHSALTSGAILKPQHFDGNRQTYFLEQANGSLVAVGGYRPVRVSLAFQDGRTAQPDILGAVQPGDIGFAGPEKLETATIEETQQGQQDQQRPHRGKGKGKKRGVFQHLLDQQQQLQVRDSQGDLLDLILPPLEHQRHQRGRKATWTVTALQTKFDHLQVGPNGVALSLYWHRSADDAVSGQIGLDTRRDVLVSPSRYTVDSEHGVIAVRDRAPSGDTRYDSFVAYYYYQRLEEGARQEADDRSAATRPVSGVDQAGYLTQRYPVTRNMTDYVNGTPPDLTAAQLDDLLPDYHPVYEYYIDDRGQLVFADSLFRFGDQPAEVLVEYDSLEIEPRLMVEFPKRGSKAFSTKTPVLRDFTVLINARK